MTQRTQNCASCRCWKQTIGEQGDCRRHAPRAVLTLELASYHVLWPSTMSYHCCGEYQPAAVDQVMEPPPARSHG